MSFPEQETHYTVEALESYAESLVNANKAKEETSRTTACIAVAGGGGNAISTLAATPGASSLLLEGTVTYDRRSYRDYVGLSPNRRPFHFNSREAARLASEAALRKALNIKGPKLNQMTACIGIASTSALVSSSSPDSFRGTGHIVATRADGAQVSIDFHLAGLDSQTSSRRTRKQEDVFVSHLILRTIELLQNATLGAGKSLVMKTQWGDDLVEDWGPVLPGDATDHPVEFSAAQRLLSGDEPALVLLPVYKDGLPVAFQAQKFAVLPNGCLVMPGSFNPPHKGHIQLGKAAIMAAIRKGFSKRHNEKPLLMELSLTNADKPAIDPHTAAERLTRFLELTDLPEHWGVLLTRAPLFAQKIDSLHDCILDHTDGPLHKFSFVIGSDTLIRILNPKYYNNDKEQMIDVLRNMKGAHFIAGGRVDQQSNGEGRFITGSEQLGDLPQDVQDKFTIITEEEFRVDVSSTEIREAERLAAARSLESSSSDSD